MENKHTPGPWAVSRGAQSYPYSIESGSKTIAFIKNIKHIRVDTFAIKETEANARLIAAAPELLEVCKLAAELVKTARRHFPKSMHNSDKFQLENINAAMGKAIAAAEREV